MNAADVVVAVHFAFVLFVVLGGLAVLRWPRLAWAHVPCFLWGAAVEFFGFYCPLTTLEKSLGATYEGGFIEHYIVPLLYPPGLTRGMQIGLGVAVLAINGTVYTVLLRRRRRA